MSEFREVYNKDDLMRIELAQGTSSRRYLRVEMPGEKFLAWFGENSISLGSSFKFSVSEVFDNKIYTENAEFTKFLPKPREDNKHNGTIFFELVGPRVIFNYIVGGAASSAGKKSSQRPVRKGHETPNSLGEFWRFPRCSRKSPDRTQRR